MPFGKQNISKNSVSAEHAISRKKRCMEHCLQTRCNAFYSYDDDADSDITKLSVQSSLKCLTTVISEIKDLLV